MSTNLPPRDIFAEAREKYSIADVWRAFGYEGEPKGSCKSPFRTDRTPSFSIHHDGRAWTDHATGKGGDVIEFVRHALGECDHKGVRDWFGERLGIDYCDFFPVRHASKPAAPPEARKVIQWPAELVEGTEETWEAFARLRGITYPTARGLVKAGVLRFCRLPDGTKCYVVTDGEQRAAEIRRLDGKLFKDAKAYSLAGVDKSWLPGAHLLRGSPPDTAVMVTEGPPDLLTATDLYVRYQNHGGMNSWRPVALLGAGCKRLDAECAELIRGRYVRLVPDADAAGDRMRDHWTEVFRHLGCTVDCVTLPRDTDLTDNAINIEPSNLFSK